MEEISHLRASRRAHLTHVFGKIATILKSDESPNERDTATLQISLEQVELKKATVAELDAKILATIANADTLETEMLDSKEVMSEKITLMKAILARPKPPNVQARPF